jgi:GAF domain-containing protein
METAPRERSQNDCNSEGDMTREALLGRTFVELADSLVDDFDVVDLLSLLADRCVDVLDVSAAGVILVSPAGDLKVVASSSEAMRILEVFEQQTDEGPCVDCVRTGQPVVSGSLERDAERWPRFAPKALAAGFASAQALPMRLRGTVIGAINMFQTSDGEMREADTAVAQAFADVATIAVLAHRAADDAQRLTDQLTLALNTRIVLEQAKGVVAEGANLDMEAAFARLRRHARNHNLRLTDVAADVASKALTLDGLDA